MEAKYNENVGAFSRFENISEDNPARVRVLVSPAKNMHDYYIRPEAVPMDEATADLYYALHKGIVSISIKPYHMHVHGPEKIVRDRIRGDWPDELHGQIVDQLANHMGWKDDIIRHESRRMDKYKNYFEAF